MSEMVDVSTFTLLVLLNAAHKEFSVKRRNKCPKITYFYGDLTCFGSYNLQCIENIDKK